MYISLSPEADKKKREKEVKSPFGINGKSNMGLWYNGLGVKYIS